MMAIAIISAAAFLGPANRSFVRRSSCGRRVRRGSSTSWASSSPRDVNYFFQPTFAPHLHRRSSTMYLAFRSLRAARCTRTCTEGPAQRRSTALKSAALGQLDEPVGVERRSRCSTSTPRPRGPIRDRRCRALLDDAPALPSLGRRRGRTRVAAGVCGPGRLELAERRWFPTAVDALIVVLRSRRGERRGRARGSTAGGSCRSPNG